MTEEQKLIFSILFLLVSVIAFVFVFIYTKKVVNKEKEIVDALEKNTIAFFNDIKLMNDQYFPYYITHASGVRRHHNYLGDKDNITGIEIGKHSKFYFDRILYIINGKLKYPYKIERINDQEYILINESIKTIELLVSFEKPSHYLFKYKVNYIEKDKFEVELVGVDNGEPRKEE